MKLFKNYSTIIIVYILVVLVTLYFNLVLDIYPALDLFKYLESKKFYGIVPITILFFTGLWLYDRRTKRKIINERVKIFNATIRTIQDILQNSYSSMQLLILDMKDDGIHEEVILKAEKSMEELNRVIKTLASLDPHTIELKELNRHMSIIKMEE